MHRMCGVGTEGMLLSIMLFPQGHWHQNLGLSLGDSIHVTIPGSLDQPVGLWMLTADPGANSGSVALACFSVLVWGAAMRVMFDSDGIDLNTFRLSQAGPSTGTVSYTSW